MRIGLTVLSFAATAMLAMPAGADGGPVFAPEGCEFSVPIAAQSAPEATEWGGRTTVSVAAETGRYAIRAACTTGYPAGALARLDREARLAFVGRLAQGMHLGAASVVAAPGADWIDVSGTMPAEPVAHLRARILYGATSRLMVEVLSTDETAAATGFNSVVSTIARK